MPSRSHARAAGGLISISTKTNSKALALLRRARRPRDDGRAPVTSPGGQPVGAVMVTDRSSSARRRRDIVAVGARRRAGSETPLGDSQLGGVDLRGRTARVAVTSLMADRLEV